jgi:hypothetical protein
MSESEKCKYCGQACVHKRKMRVSKTNPMEVDVEMVDYHLECKHISTKMKKVEEKIMKQKKRLHDLRAEHLNLEFKIFLKTMSEPDSDDEIQMVLSGATGLTHK